MAFIVAPHLRHPCAPSSDLGTSRAPAGDEAGIGAFGLLDPAALFLPVAFDVVGVGGPLLATRSLASSLELHVAQLPGMQGWSRPGVALGLRQQMPDHDSELACGGDGCDVLAAAGSHTQEEGSQRSRRTRRRPGCLDEHAAGMASSLLGDPPVVGRPRS